MKKILTILMLPLLLLILIGCTKSDRTKVVTSSFFSYDITRALMKDTNIEVAILRQPGQKDIHDYDDLTVASKELMKQAIVFIYTSNRHDNKFLNDYEVLPFDIRINLFEKLFPQIKERDVLTSHHNHENNDHHHESGSETINPHDYMHYWASATNMVKLSDIIAEKLAATFSRKRSTILSNLATYKQQLNDEINNFKTFLIDKNIADKKLFFIGHDSLGYLFYDFGLKKIYKPLQNSIQHLETNVSEFNGIISKIKASNTKVLFKAELGEKDKEVAAITEKINDPNIKVLELTGYHHLNEKQFKDGLTYLNFFKQNINNIKTIFD